MTTDIFRFRIYNAVSCQRMCDTNNTTGATGGAQIVYTSGAYGLTPGFSEVRVY